MLGAMMPRKKKSPPPPSPPAPAAPLEADAQTPQTTPPAEPDTRPIKKPLRLRVNVEEARARLAAALLELAPGVEFTEDTHDQKGRPYPVELELAGSLPVWAVCAFSAVLPSRIARQAAFTIASITVRQMADSTLIPGFDWTVRATYPANQTQSPVNLVALGVQGQTARSGLERTVLEFKRQYIGEFKKNNPEKGDAMRRAGDLLETITRAQT